MSLNWKKLALRPASPSQPTSPNSARSEHFQQQPDRRHPHQHHYQQQQGRRPQSSLSRFSEQEVDELDGWLRRIESLQSARPEKVSFPSRRNVATSGINRSATQSHARSPSEVVSPVRLASGAPHRTEVALSSIDEATPRPSSALQRSRHHSHSNKSSLETARLLRRRRSKSLSETLEVITDSPIPTLYISSGHSNPSFTATPGASIVDDSGLLEESRVYTRTDRKRQSLPLSLSLAKSRQLRFQAGREELKQRDRAEDSDQGTVQDSDRDSEEGERTISAVAYAETSEDEEAEGEGDRTVHEFSSDDYFESDKTPEIPSTRLSTARKVEMASPGTKRFDPTATVSSTHSTTSGDKTFSTGGASRSSLKFQPRSPLVTPRSPEWHRRRFEASDDSSIDNEDGPTHTDGPAKRDRVTATEALREMLKYRSQESLGSSGSRPNAQMTEGQEEDANRQSIDSRASSIHSSRPWVRVSKTSTGGATAVSHASPSAPARRPKLEARDDRAISARRPLRPRFNSSRSASSLPLDGEGEGLRSSSPHFTQHASWHESDVDSDNESLRSKEKRRASISSTSQLYSSAEGARLAATSRASSHSSKRGHQGLAPPVPKMARSFSYDYVAQQAQSSQDAPAAGSTSNGSSIPAEQSLQDFRSECWLWLSPSSTYSLDPQYSRSFASSSHHKSLGKVLLGNVPGKKKVQKRESTQFSGLVASPSAPNFLFQAGAALSDDGKIHKDKDAKGKGKDKSSGSSMQPEGIWRRCEARLQSSGLLGFYAIEPENQFMSSLNTSTLRQTDIRSVDQSLFGRQRCIALHLRGTNTYPITEKTLAVSSGGSTSQFPSSPSAPDFNTIRAFGARHRPTDISYAEQQRRLADLLGPPQPVYLCFSSTAATQAWLVALRNHAQAEIYPHPNRSQADLAAVDMTAEVQTDEEEASDAGVDEESTTLDRSTSSIMSSPKSAAGSNRLEAASRRRQYMVDRLSSQQAYSVRPSRSIELQIIEGRAVRPRDVVPVNYATTSLPRTPASTTFSPTIDPADVPLPNDARKAGSIASGSATSAQSSEEVHLPNTTAVETPSSSLSPSLQSVQYGLAALAVNGTSPYNYRPKDASSKKEKEEREKQEAKRDVYCEVWLEGEIVARTAFSRSAHAPVWQESFRFSNLGPFNSPLTIRLMQHHRTHTTLLGHVEIPVQTFRRSHIVEDWFPIVLAFDSAKPQSVEAGGEMSLSVRVQEDMILPMEAYEQLLQILEADGDCSVIYSLLSDSNVEIEDVASLLLRVNIAQRRVLDRLAAMAEREVAQSEGNASILFRGNTLLTKSVELYLRTVGVDFLESSIGDVIRQICKEKVEIEIDPSRLQAIGRERTLAENVQDLESWTRAVWDAIYNNRHQCPSDLRLLMRKIQSIVEDRFHLATPSVGHDETRRSSLSDLERSKMRFTSVSAFIFLRFFGPAVLNPRLFGLCANHPPNHRTQRTLTLIAKTLQGLANLTTFGGKEPWMAAMNPFVQSHVTDFEDLISHICSTPTSARPQWTRPEHDLYAVPAACQKTQLAEGIVREAVPSLPFLIDLPRELAVLASTVAQGQKAGREDTPIKPHSKLVEVCTSLHHKTRARVRSLERTGKLSLSGRQVNRTLMARAEPQTRANSTRSRGTTVSRSTFGGASHSLHSTPPSRSPNFLNLSSPASTGSPVNSSFNIDEEGSSTLSIPAGSTGTKRRSHTVSGTPAPSTSSPQRPATSSGDKNGDSDILKISLPPGYDATSNGSYRRTTVSARPKLNTATTEPTLPSAQASRENLAADSPSVDPVTPKALDNTWRLQQEMARQALAPSLGLEHEYAAQEAAAAAKHGKRSPGGWLRRKTRGEKDPDN